MSVIDTLIYDRTQFDVDRVYELKHKYLTTGLSAAELSEYNGGMKGAYNFTDLNRVGNAQVYLKELFDSLPAELQTHLSDACDAILASLRYPSEYYSLEDPLLPDSYATVSYSYPIVLEAVKTNWTVSNIPGEVTDSSKSIYAIGYYLNNINVLRNILALSNAPSTPTTMDHLNYDEANAIEYILFMVYEAYVDYGSDKHGTIDDSQEAEIEKYALEDTSWFWSNEVFAGE